MKKLVVIGFIISFLSACEKEADVELPPIERVPVMSSFLCAGDSVVVAKLTWTDPIFEDAPEDGQYITGANVYLTDGITQVPLHYDNMYQHYISDTHAIALVPGNNYTLTAVANGKTVYASTQIPVEYASALTLFNVTMDPGDSTAGYSAHANIEMSWNDVPNQKSYYYISVFNLLEYPVGDTMDYYSYSYFLTDSGNENGSISTNSESYFNLGYTPIGVKVVVATINPDYYNFVSTVTANSYSQGPFTEPVLIYTNVNGGRGVLGGYRKFETVHYF